MARDKFMVNLTYEESQQVERLTQNATYSRESVLKEILTDALYESNKDTKESEGDK